HPFSSWLRVFRTTLSDGRELSVRRRVVAPPHAWLGLRALRCSRRRFRGRDYHLYGIEQSQANDWHPPEQSGGCSLHWTRGAATLCSGENVSRAQRGILAGGIRLQGNPVHEAPDARIRPERLARWARRLDSGTVALLG